MRHEYLEFKAKPFVFRLTESMINGLKKNWKKIAKEDMVIEYSAGFFHATGSELAILRLVAAYRYHKDAHYREDKPHLFALDINPCFQNF